MRTRILCIILAALLLLACCTSPAPVEEQPLDLSSYSVATFAGGCFWCTESDFEKVNGVVEAVSGYANGRGDAPTYDTYGENGFIEAVQVYYDPAVVSYRNLLDHHWMTHDPTDNEGQFVDRGAAYRPAVFFTSEEEQTLAQESKQELMDSQVFAKPVVTEILPLYNFYPAEDYHQDYHTKNPVRYNYYRSRSGRDKFLEKMWGDTSGAVVTYSEGTTVTLIGEESDFVKPSDEELKETLSPLQYKVTQQDGTEPAFENEYWDNKEEGIYADIVSGEALFSSTHKYKSGTGWPSFSQPITEDNIVKKRDYKLIYPRTEIRSKQGDNHIGHVFSDGPEPTGLRYCMNSAALRFVPLEDMEEEGYEEYLYLFEEAAT